jgi:hypothetical protein
MDNIVGYCTIKPNATSGIGVDLQSFIGKDCRVMEFASDGGVLVLNREATAMAMFDKADVKTSFKCSPLGDVLCPSGLNFIEQTLYANKVLMRKGGYNNLLKNMVIGASLSRGVFTDDFLFSVEREENQRRKMQTQTNK